MPALLLSPSAGSVRLLYILRSSLTKLFAINNASLPKLGSGRAEVVSPADASRTAAASLNILELIGQAAEESSPILLSVSKPLNKMSKRVISSDDEASDAVLYSCPSSAIIDVKKFSKERFKP